MSDTNIIANEKSPKQHKPWQFKPGQVANPAGRPKGARNRLGEQFLQDLYDDWFSYGNQVLAEVRERKPAIYLQVVASILPKILQIKEDDLEGMSDNELADIIAAIRASALSHRRAKAVKRIEQAKEPQEASEAGRAD